MLLAVLAARSLKRQSFCVKSLYIQREQCYRMFQRSAVRPSRVLRVSVAGGGALTATLMLLGYSLYADPSPLKEPTPTPLSKLLTSYVVYSACSVPGLVEASPSLLAFCTSIPGLRQLTEALVRSTFFEQVVSFVST
jgi:proline dehydrogenase